MSSEQRQYRVTLNSYEDKESFRDDMETPGGNLYIPDRIVDPFKVSSISRTIDYYLTDEEADQLRQDPRVYAVELTMKESGISIEPLGVPATQTSSNWDVSDIVAANMLNWGLVRCTRTRPKLVKTGDSYPNAVGMSTDITAFNSKPVGFKFLPWNTLKMQTKTASGWNIATSYWDLVGVAVKSGDSWGDYSGSGYYNTSITASVTLGASGKNVDLVVVDGGIVPTGHPEYAKNPDGSGGTRCIQYNWYQHNAALGNGANGTYPYSGSATSQFGHKIEYSYHAMHCTGTAGGVTQGWAKEANIYNITFFEPDVIDYVREFHRNKPINPLTGRKNPTVCTNSWGSFLPAATSAADVKKVVYRGTTYNAPFTAQQLSNWGVYLGGQYRMSARNAATDASVADAIKEGIIFIAAAGNFSYRNDSASGPDFDNEVTYDATIFGTVKVPYTTKYNAGPSPGGLKDDSTRLQIGALWVTPWDAKANFSNCGPGIDFYAPGYNIISAFLNNPNIKPAVPDSRNGNFYLQKLQGTSMATPQVAGIAACLMEIYPHWNNKELKKYLIETCEKDQIVESPTTYGNPFFDYDIKGSPNRIVKFKNQRNNTGSSSGPIVGITYPKQQYGIRNPAGGVVAFPRTRSGKK